MVALTLLQWSDGQFIQLLELCVTPVCTQETCVCALQGQLLSVNFHFPAFPGTRSRSKPPKPRLLLTCLARILAVSLTVSEGCQFCPKVHMEAHSSLCIGQSSF